MNVRRLLCIGATLLAVVFAAPSAAQLLPPPPDKQPPLPELPPPPPPPIESKIDPDLRTLMDANPATLLPVIVEMQHPVAPFECAIDLGLRPNVCRANEALIALGSLGDNGVPVAGLALINAAAGSANAAGISALSLLPTVAFIHHDRTVGPRQRAVEPPPTLPDEFAPRYSRTVRAHPLWDAGITGNGVTVAVLDSGVVEDQDLTVPANRVLRHVNFADKLETTDLDDPGGHGTHVAGIVAGNGSRSDGEFVGVAPQANIVDVRVLGKKGTGRMSSVIRGIEWVLAHRAEHNIRVINLSLGAPAPVSYRVDPLSAAVEIAWRRGLVVVAASGNTGDNTGPEPVRDTVTSPGIDPYVITVGATDSHGTRNANDDTLAWFSAWGSADSNPKPDLVAPGRRLASVYVPWSMLDERYHDRVVSAPNGSRYFRLTGTSQSTGVVSGVAALLLQSQPNLTPNEVKAALVGATQAYGWDTGPVLPDPIADGRGMVDAQDADKATTRIPPPPAVNNGLRPSDAFARAMYPVLYGTPLRWKDPLLGGILWDLLTWDTLAWNSVAWDNFDWDSVAWDSVAWDSVAWDSVAWDSVAWDSVAWDSVAWDTYTLD